MAGLFMFGANSALQSASAEGDTRTLSFHHTHTNEDITITFKRNGRYDDAALKKLNYFMRDWRKNEEIAMDPHLFDLLWEVSREVGHKGPIQVICGYRTPDTNIMLRARSVNSGVAEVSQHSAGHAMDFSMPGVPLEKIREVGLRLQRGGVGFYPTSGSPFVHLDTGNVRHWPRMTYAQLQKVFPDGRTVHMPSDGHPLPGYALALADLEKRGNAPNGTSLAAARAAGVITAAQEQEAEGTVRTASNDSPNTGGSFLTSLFGGAQQTPEAPDDAATSPTPKRVKQTIVASARAVTPQRMPVPSARPKILQTQVASAAADTTPWPGVTISKDGTTPSPFRNTYQVADAAEGAYAMGYAPTDIGTPAKAAPRPSPQQALPMGRTTPTASIAAPDAALVPVSMPELTFGGQGIDSPWLRAMTLAPSVSAMASTHIGTVDPRIVTAQMQKPTQALILGFAGDPAVGITAARFTGTAVVFMATARFAPTQTASLK